METLGDPCIITLILYQVANSILYKCEVDHIIREDIKKKLFRLC